MFHNEIHYRILKKKTTTALVESSSATIIKDTDTTISQTVGTNT